MIWGLRSGRTIALISLATVLSACGNPSTDIETAPETFQSIQDHLTFLASDEQMGRAPGTPGFDRAADYTAAAFKAAGLSPISETDGYCHKVTISEATLDNPASFLAVGEQTFESTHQELLITAPLNEGEEALEGELVFVGYGIDAPEFGITPFAEVDLDGKIAVHLNGFPPSLPGLMGAHLASQKPKDLLRRGAVATIEIETPMSLGRRPWTLIRDFFTEPRGSWVNADGEATSPLPRSTVRSTGGVTEKLFAAAPVSLQSVFDKAERGDPTESFDLKTDATIRRSAATSQAQSCNIVGILPGSDPALKDEAVIFMAHLDHMGADDGGIYNGALDNAIGVAILMDVAQGFFEDDAIAPKRTVIFAAVTAEEKGLLGADALASRPSTPNGVEIVSVFNIDMPTLTFPIEDVVLFGEAESSLGTLARNAAEDAGLIVSADPSPANGLFVRSDHYVYVQRGVPAIYVKPGGMGEGEAAIADFLRNHYHQYTDDLNIEIDWDTADRYSALHADILLRAANAEQRAEWLEGSVFALPDEGPDH